MSDLTINTIEDSTTFAIHIEGAINESFLQKSVRVPQQKKIIIDFTAVTSINSLGIRHWIQWLRTYPNSEYTFRACPQCIVDQLNSVSDFMPVKCTIESFFVPYYGENSGEEMQVLYKLNEDYFSNAPLTIKLVKDSMGNKMEIDSHPQKYFKFLTVKRAP